MFLKVSQNSQENTCEFCDIFKNAFFTEHLRTSTSVKRGKSQLLIGIPVNRRYIKKFIILKCITEMSKMLTFKNSFHNTILFFSDIFWQNERKKAFPVRVLLRKKTYLNFQRRSGREGNFPKLFIIGSFCVNFAILLLFVMLINFQHAPRPGKFWRFAFNMFPNKRFSHTEDERDQYGF